MIERKGFELDQIKRSRGERQNTDSYLIILKRLRQVISGSFCFVTVLGGFSQSMRPLYVGNLESDTRQKDLERLFRNYGNIEQIDVKSGFAFVYFENMRDAEYAIRETRNKPFGFEQRKLSVDWAQGERWKSGGQMPCKTLYVNNFEPTKTKKGDVERKFEKYGEVLSVNMKYDHAFVKFARQKDATKALERTNNTKILDRIVVVEYAWRKENDICTDMPRMRSPIRRSRSSPVYDTYNGPVVSNVESSRSRHRRRRSPSYDRYRSRSPVRRART